MSILAELHSYWAGNSTLNTALPATKVYTGLVPEATAFPYAVVVPINMVPTFTTGQGYVETFGFQISVFDTNPDNVDALADTIAGQFDYKTISSQTISCERINGPVFVVDPDTTMKVYHALLEYRLNENKTVGTT
jgi:hypothetical protein